MGEKIKKDMCSRETRTAHRARDRRRGDSIWPHIHSGGSHLLCITNRSMIKRARESEFGEEKRGKRGRGENRSGRRGWNGMERNRPNFDWIRSPVLVFSSLVENRWFALGNASIEFESNRGRMKRWSDGAMKRWKRWRDGQTETSALGEDCENAMGNVR